MHSVSAVIGTALTAAVQAPSARHRQPWLFEVAGTQIRLLLNRSALVAGDETDARAARQACGAALCNLCLSVRGQGWIAQTKTLPDPAQPDLLALVHIAGERADSAPEARFGAVIDLPNVGQHVDLARAVPAPVRSALEAVVSREGARLLFIDGSERYRGLTGLLTAPQDEDTPGLVVGQQASLAAVLTPGLAERDDVLAGAAIQHALLTAATLGLVAELIPQPFDGQAARDEVRAAFAGRGHARALMWLGYPPPVVTPPRRPLGEVSSPLR